MHLDPLKQLANNLSGALKGLRLYPVEHPIIQKQLRETARAAGTLLQEHEHLRIGVLQDTLFINDHLFADPHPAAESLCRLFQEKQLAGLEFLKGIPELEFRHFLQFMNSPALGQEDFQALFDKHQVRHIRFLPDEAEEDDDRQSARKIYGRALKLVNTIFKDVRMGRIPSSAEAHKVVKDMARMTLADPHALLALSLLKNYDNYTFTHSVNVSVLALAIGRAAGLQEEQLRILGIGSLLHDIGKLKIDISIINKPGRLSESEFAEIRKHPRIGADIIQQMGDVIEAAIAIVLGHHLHFDRKGYPGDVTISGSYDLIDMTTIADSYDAITTLRPYQRPTTPREAIRHLMKESGTMLHPDYLKKFVASLGTYPVGTLVRLDSNEIGVVGRVGIDNPDCVQVKILFDGAGAQLNQPRLINLAADEKKRIVSEVDPFLKGVDVVDYL
ncbi:MAG: HD-GYP domain-containing protein [Syntrophotalea acetylenica]|nr:HD-GYP domain-containing protein [Syntrophotalea acetylenica]